MKTNILNDQEIYMMRQSGLILREVLQIVSDSVKPGVTTIDLDKIAKAEILKRNAKPAFLNYQGFSHSICISINDEIVHGVPGDRKINNGDIVGLDLGVDFEGMITDAAVTIAVGNISEEAKNMIKITQKALFSAIDIVKAGIRVGDISAKIEKVLLSGNLSIVKSLTGHGVGHKLHEEPTITNYGVAGTGPMLKENMAIAIEPISSISSEKLRIKKDGWTCATIDGSLSAHFEHTILIKKNGCEILT